MPRFKHFVDMFYRPVTEKVIVNKIASSLETITSRVRDLEKFSSRVRVITPEQLLLQDIHAPLRELNKAINRYRDNT